MIYEGVKIFLPVTPSKAWLSGNGKGVPFFAEKSMVLWIMHMQIDRNFV
jgi:hypothetical protein